jgi:HAMP domain-containing protein
VTGRKSRKGKLAAAGVILAAAFVTFWHFRTEPTTQPVRARARAVAATLPADAPPAPPVIAAANEETARLHAALGDAMSSVTDAERVVDESNASLDLEGLLQPKKLGTAAGRESLLGMLERAEEFSKLRRQVTGENLERVRTAALAAPVAPLVAQDFLQAFDVRAVETLRAADQLHEMELQAIATSRHMIAFMEQNQARYQLRGDSLMFSSQGMQVQYMHYLTQVGQMLQRQTRARGLAVAARQDQAQLVESLAGG